MRSIGTLLALSALHSLFVLTAGKVRSLQMVQQPGGCIGGEVCLVQPSLQVIDVITRQIDFSFTGSVYAQISDTPTGYEQLFIGDGCDYYGCEQLVVGTLASVDFEEGLAVFDNLYIRESGSSFTLKFIGVTQSGEPFAQAVSDEFDVVVGSAYQLVFHTFMGTAFGGIPFSPNPVVAVADRGGNAIASLNSGQVAAVLTRTPTTVGNGSSVDTNITALEQLRPAENTVVDIVDGLAAFEGLYINKSGYPYQITFESSLTSIPPLKSRRFDVAVGFAAQLELVEGFEPSFSAKYAGEFFTVPPRLRLLDAGGNLVRFDNSSALRVTIGDNPAGGALSPAENTFAVADEGVVTFNALRIDRQSLNYTLQFTLFEYSPLQKRFFETPVRLTSEKFHLEFGPPRQLQLERAAGGAWSGLQAFDTQPVLHLQDFGGNVLQLDSDSTATALLVESLSVHSDVVIDTSDAPQVRISRAEALLQNGSYGAGQIIDVVLAFDAHLWVRRDPAAPPAAPAGAPYILLNVDRPANASSNTSSAPAPASASLVGATEQTKTLTFRYVVQPRDAAALLDFAAVDALALNGSLIVDGNGRAINTTLPLPGVARSRRIEVDTAPPRVVAVSTNTSDGEYGAGQVIDFLLTFDKQVTISGTPFFTLTAGNASDSGGGGGSSGNSSSSSSDAGAANGTAVFAALSEDCLTAHFHYAVAPGDATFDIGFGEVLTILGDEIVFSNVTANNTIVEYGNFTANASARYRYSYAYSNAVGGAILRKSDKPLTRAAYAIGQLRAGFAGSHSIVIDTSPPQLSAAYGVRTAHRDGLFYPGEHIPLTVQFTKPVAYFGNGIYLRLDAGPHGATPQSDYTGYAWVQRLREDNVTMEFLYVVERNVNTTRLDLAGGGDALQIVQRTAYIRRQASVPAAAAAAQLNTAALHLAGASLRDTARIALLGYAPTVLSVNLIATDPPGAAALRTDDSALIQVTFSAPIVASCRPVVVIAAGYQREAAYVSGNATDTFLFQYTVSFGDQASAIRYRHTPDALCSASGCPYVTHCSMRANATSPVLEANLRLPRPDAVASVAIGSAAIEPSTDARNTTVQAIRCLNAAGEYGAGSVLSFEVTFSDLVRLRSFAPDALPRLRLSTGQYAAFNGMLFREKKLLFAYITTESDVLVDAQLAVEAPSGADSAIDCAAHSACAILNQAGLPADLATASANISSTGITLDPAPPNITRVWTEKPTAPYESGEYSVGEEVLVQVQFSKPVAVAGFPPRLALDLGRPERYAVYSRSLSRSAAAAASSDSVLIFRYLVQPGDASADLRYLNGSIDLYGGYSEIFRRASLPTTAADVTLPRPAPLAVGGAVVRINTERVPRVTNVTSLPLDAAVPGAALAVGDFAIIRVDFSHEVVAEGNSYLDLNLGDAVRRAHYIGYFDAAIGGADAGFDAAANFTVAVPNTPSNATRHLYYRYDVSAGDFTADLEYVDVFSLHPGLTDVGDPGHIRYAATATATATATAARLDADLDLPQPHSPGALSGDGAVLRVDGSAPFVTRLDIVTPDGTYGAGAAIHIEVGFSAPVWVEGRPILKLETGLVDNHALYVNGSRTDTLLFAYVPEPGDASIDLDYHSERSLFNSAIRSFQLRGGSVSAYSAAPSLPADIWLNPPFGALQSRETLLCHDPRGGLEQRCLGEYGPRPRGGVQQVAAAGKYLFKDLRIDWRGPNYQLRYTAAPPLAHRLLTTTQFVDVSFSAEQMLRPERALRDQLVGFSVDIDGDIAVFGCPNCNRSVFPVQAVVQSAQRGDVQREVQSLQTFVAAQPAIQSFHTTGDVGTVLSGTFSVSHDLFGPSQGIPANADPAVMQSLLAFDLPSLGNVTITRQPYIFCACENAFTWTLTFHDIVQGEFSPLTLDGAGLTSAGAAVVGPQVLQEPALLSGTFTISALGRTSSPIAYDAGVAAVTAAVEELGLSVFNVLISSSTATRSRVWSIEFDDYLDAYDVPLLEADGSGLRGGNASVFVQVSRPGRHGPFGISGYFQLQWRGNTTAPLPAYATAAEVKAALEALPVINFVNVNRSREALFHGYTWTIEFVSVNRMTPRGLVLQDAENVEPIVPVNRLIGNDVRLDVHARYRLGEEYRVYNLSRQGTFGAGAGAVHVYQRRNETWDEVATLRGNDTVENNRFGTSVALFGDVLLVGAIGASMNGVPEQQSIYCAADAGSFRISFRGWTSAAISFNVTRLQLIDAITSDSRIFEKLYTVRLVAIEDWGPGPLCANNSALITFYSPVDGAELLTGSDGGADLELLTLESVDLSYRGSAEAALLQAAEVRKGTWRLHGADSDPQQIGAAYVFRANYSCGEGISSTLCRKRHWPQEAQFFPTASIAGSRFGAAVALSERIALVGAPGSADEEGLVYVFEYFEQARAWVYLQVVGNPLLSAGDHFGAAVAVAGDTVVVGAPDRAASTGGVFTYTRPATGGAFIFSQSLEPAAEFALSPGDLCGTSVRVQDNLLLVGCPGYHDAPVHFGDTAGAQRQSNTGAVFLFSRVSSFFNFRFREKLTPSAAQQFDRFGFAADMDGDRLVVSAFEDFDGALLADKVVVEVATRCAYGRTPLGGFFRLKWLATNTTSNGRHFITRPIAHDASAEELRLALESDLPAGPLIVDRSRVDAYDGGYAWRVTFMAHEAFVNLFESDTTLLAGTDAAVSTRFVNPNPLPLRGKAHVFQRRSAQEPFVEQLLLSPHRYQPMDRCGRSAALSGQYAIVGCPNRDLFIPTHNSGAAFVFHLGLLGVQFAAPFTVLEGNNASIQLRHDPLNFAPAAGAAAGAGQGEDLLFYVQSVDRNANSSAQDFIRHLFGIAAPQLLFPQTPIDRAEIAGTAMARSQFYGSHQNQSQWVDGLYDYRAIADYVHLRRPHVFLAEEETAADTLVTTADSILETPDEYVVLAISSPGVWPSIFGRLYGQVRIYDPSDGFLWGGPRYAKLYDSTGIASAGISTRTTAAVSATLSALPDGGESGAEFGAAVAVSEQLGVMLVGAPLATATATAAAGAAAGTGGGGSGDAGGRAAAGKVLFYKRSSDGNWTQDATSFSSPTPELNGSSFGAAVAVTHVFERGVSVIAIGEPRINRVHVYAAEGVAAEDLSTGSFQLERSFAVPGEEGAAVVQWRFGDRGTLALHDYLLVAAAPGLESCWVYRRFYDNSTGSWQWADATLLRASDFDFDVISGSPLLHRQDFGAALGASGRTIVIGAPFADYQKLGSDLVEVEWLTEGVSIGSTGRGRAYVFYSAPAVQRFFITAPEPLRYGQFQLMFVHQGWNATTRPLDYDVLDVDLVEALQALPNIDRVAVSSRSYEGGAADSASASASASAPFAATAGYAVGGYAYEWTVTFLSDWTDPPLLQPLWRDFGCGNCSYFSFLVDSSFAPNVSLNASSAMRSESLAPVGALAEVQTLSAQDRRMGDRFGASVAIDGDQIAVGAPMSAAMTTTTWDFEAGTLVGWTKTGDAFDSQPTYGDNGYIRGGNSGVGTSRRLRRSTQSVGLVGRYYIGTYERRMGNPDDYSTPHPAHPEGGAQGDGPRGTLSSEVFMIRGADINFLVGGGCDAYVEFVELLVDGVSVGKHTGSCAEKMRRVHFDVSGFPHRAAQIRIVDNSSAPWGHINVDDFRFDWDVHGATVQSGTPPKNLKQAVGGLTETPHSGAVYLFHRHGSGGPSTVCSDGDKRNCSWAYEAKFTASDKRADMRFGAAVAVNDAAGVVAVAAPRAPVTGFFKEVPSAHPHLNASDGSTAAGLKFPVSPASMLLFDSDPLYVPQRSGSSAVWQLLDARGIVQDAKAYEQGGAVYVFVKSHAKLASTGEVAVPQFWTPTEHAKIQPPDAVARDAFGTSLVLDGNTLAAGAVGQDGLLRDAGAVYIFRTEFASLRFSAIEYPVLEGSLRFVTVTMLRDLNVYDGPIALEYATSDLTAKGVDSVKFDSCLNMPVLERGPAGCGDYEHTSGVFFIPAGDRSGGFTVRIMDDLCHERFLEFIQITVSIPGSGALQGEAMSAKIRIDDDDYASAGFC